MKGTIIKGIAGFYYVKAGAETYQCKARGIFKKRNLTPTVGDLVEVELVPDGDGIINEILPRSNCFIRPPVANVDCFVVVVAATRPEPNFAVIDRFLVMAEKNHTDVVLCINKSDIASESHIKDITNIYQELYPIVELSALTDRGLVKLKKKMAGEKTALAGPSGVGKSTILNKLCPGVDAETGDLSGKTKRGKHTTRHVELFEIEEGAMVFDTPGFTSFDILTASEEELHFLYPEMRAMTGKCKFDNCRHVKEPGCAVKEAVQEQKIHTSRYQSYLTQLKEIQETTRY